MNDNMVIAVSAGNVDPDEVTRRISMSVRQLQRQFDKLKDSALEAAESTTRFRRMLKRARGPRKPKKESPDAS